MRDCPTHVGPFEIERPLGAGGMAETFVGIRRGPGGFVQRACVKRVLPSLGGDPAFVSQFLEEAKVSARLRHASIAQVLDFGRDGDGHYLALELVEGTDLARLLRHLARRGARLAPALVAYLGAELAAALEHAHGAAPGRGPVVHRDVSPSNVLLSRAGEVKLTDFGIARPVGPSGAATATSHLRGKVPYMAPEYALTGRADPRADLFSLGVLLYEALAGARPFVGANDVETLQRILDDARAPLASLAPEAPAALVAVIERLLARTPEARFASAAALVDALPTTADGRRLLARAIDAFEVDEADEVDEDRDAAPTSGRDHGSTTEPTLRLTSSPRVAAMAPARVAGPEAPTLTRARDGVVAEVRRADAPTRPERPALGPKTVLVDVAPTSAATALPTLGERTATAVGPALAAELAGTRRHDDARIPPTLHDATPPFETAQTSASARTSAEAAREAATTPDAPAARGVPPDGRRGVERPALRRSATRVGPLVQGLVIVLAGVLLGLGVLAVRAVIVERPAVSQGTP